MASVFALVLSVSALPPSNLSKKSYYPDNVESVKNSCSIEVVGNECYTTEQPGSHYTGYVCGTTFYKNEHIEKTVEKACKAIHTKSLIKPKYPKIYDPKNPTSIFRDITGNQYQFPILRKGFYTRLSRARKHRVVLNRDCKLGGLVVRKKTHPWYKLGFGGKTSFTKCYKVYEKNRA